MSVMSSELSGRSTNRFYIKPGKQQEYSMNEGSRFTRRKTIQMATGMAAGGALMAFGAQTMAAAAASRPANGSLRYRDPLWNRDTFAKLQGNLDFDKQKIGWFGGKVYGVRENEPLRELFGMEGFSVTRLQRLADGSWRKLLREVGFYRDLRTGQLMDTWKNSYTGETVDVVPIANDPFNFTISDHFPEPPSYGGLNDGQLPPRVPFILPWSEKGDMVLLTTDIHLYYPSALKPDKWPRESPGPMSRVSELFRYDIPRASLADASLTSIEYFGTWSRVTPWLPWMLMDQAPGHVLYLCDMGAFDSFDNIPRDVLAQAEKMDPKWLEAPYKDYGPSLSSLENYARTQKPASPRR